MGHRTTLLVPSTLLCRGGAYIGEGFRCLNVDKGWTERVRSGCGLVSFSLLLGSADPQRSVIVCKTEAMCGLAVASYSDQPHGIKISLILKESDAFRIRD
jgi:hypothetical protein